MGRPLPVASLVVFAAMLHAAPALAQRSVGEITGSVREQIPSGTTARLLLIESTSRTVIQEIRLDDRGNFAFRDVPLGHYYTVRLMLDSATAAERRVVVASSVPVHVTIESLRRSTTPEVNVTAERVPLDRMKTGAHTFYTAADIAALPTVSSEKSIEALLLATPGVVPDEDGRLHVRGEDAQLQYVVDGIPITANMTRVYASLFNAAVIKSADIQTGGLDAEYGRTTAAVLAITTKSGFDRPFFLNARGTMGSFDTREIGAEVGGNISNWGGLYIAGATSRSGRYLDPIAPGDPIHNDGEANHLFGKLDILPAAGVDIDIIGGYNHTRYDVPNGDVRTPAQDQQNDLSDYMAGARLNAELSDNLVASVMGYMRHAESRFTSGGLMRIGSAADSVRAVGENEKFFIGAERTGDVRGGQVELALRGDWLSAGSGAMHHEARAGFGVEEYPLEEFFTFAVTNPALSEPDSAGGDIRYRPYDLTRGGRPFLVDTKRTGNSMFAFLQDQITWDNWSVSLGLRYDMFDLLDRESDLSPRLGVNYAVNDDLVLFGSYNRIVMQAPMENILVSSSSEAQLLAGAEQGTTPTAVRSERSHNIELGAGYHLTDFLTLDASVYGKMIENFIVKVELGNSGIIFPVNLKEGMVAGGELRLRMRPWNHLSGFLSLAGGTAIGLKPEDGSSPIAAGLILGEEGKNYSHPFAGEDAFNTEHNQLLTAAFNLTWHGPAGLFATLGGRLDSGLPFDLTDKNGNGLDPEASREELRRRGYTDDVIDLLELESEEEGTGTPSPDKSVAPHATFDIAAGIDLGVLLGVNARAVFTAANVFDTPYLYKFESSFGGTHFGMPRTLSLRIEAGL